MTSAAGACLDFDAFEQEAKREPYRLYEMPAWLDRDLPAKDYLLGHWLYTMARVLIAADSGIGKTMLSLEIAFAVAVGRAFLHWPAGRACRVLFIDSEMGCEECKARLAELRGRYGIASANLIVISLEDFPDAPPLDSDNGHRWLLEIVGAVGAELIILDNLMGLVAGSLKDDEVWKAVLPLAKRLTALRIGQIWVHHTGHDASRFYGTRTIIWQMTAAIHLERVADSGVPLAFKLTFQKARGRRSDTSAEYAEATITFDGTEWSASQQASHNRLRGGVEEQFFQALIAAIDDYGEPLPRGPKYPTRRGVQVEKWKDQCRRRGLLDPKEEGRERPANAERAYFSKYKLKLIERNAAREYGGYVWLCN